MEASGISGTEIAEKLNQIIENSGGNITDISDARTLAEFDVLTHIYHRFFRVGDDVPVERVESEDNRVIVKGEDERVGLRVRTEAEARFLADCALTAVGLDEEAARVGQR